MARLVEMRHALTRITDSVTQKVLRQLTKGCLHLHLGTPTSHIFIINKIGNLKHQMCESKDIWFKERLTSKICK